MKRFIFNQSIDQEIIEKFIALVESSDDQIHIYLTSNGGSETGMLILLDIINADPGRFTITAMEKIYSAAFELFFSVRCTRYLAPATLGMCHLTWQAMSIMSNGAPRYDEEHAMKIANNERTHETKRFLEGLGVQKKQMALILKGEDVYFQHDELVKFLLFQSLGLQEPAKEGV